MSDRANLVRVLTAATGTGTMTLGAAYSQLFMTSAEANMVDGRTYTYLIVDGNNWELGKGVYTASGTTLSRVTVLASRISSTLGTTKVTLSGTAQVRIIESADDMGALRGTRAVTGTSDTLAQTDLGRAVTYSNAAAIAVSLAQAGASSSFLDGWATWVQNLGAGAVTMTPATSTINGAATLVLAQNLGAFIWSDGTNYHAYYVPITKPLLAANNLSDLASAATARTNLGATSTGSSLFTAADATAAREILPHPGALFGLTLSTAGSSATFGIAAGFAADSTNVSLMKLASAYTKTTSAWAVGSGNGALDSSTIANSTWYHVYLIKRTDTGVVDVLISLSATAPTLPTNYTLSRRLGSMKTNGSAQWTKFIQTGDTFIWDVPTADYQVTNPGTAAVTRTLTTPLGVKVQAIITVTGNGSVSQTDNPGAVLISDLSIADNAPVAGNGITSVTAYSATAALQLGAIAYVFTNTSSQVRSRLQLSQANTILSIATLGWVDTRGRDA